MVLHIYRIKKAIVTIKIDEFNRGGKAILEILKIFSKDKEGEKVALAFEEKTIQFLDLLGNSLK